MVSRGTYKCKAYMANEMRMFKRKASFCTHASGAFFFTFCWKKVENIFTLVETIFIHSDVRISELLVVRCKNGFAINLKGKKSTELTNETSWREISLTFDETKGKKEKFFALKKCFLYNFLIKAIHVLYEFRSIEAKNTKRNVSITVLLLLLFSYFPRKYSQIESSLR